MEIIPAVNCLDFRCVREKVKIARDVGSEWVHFDVSDGVFTDYKNWNEPERLAELGEELTDLKIEVHLMVQEPQAEIERWCAAGVSRIIVHAEVLEHGWPMIIDKIDNFGVELGIAINPETPPHILKPYLKAVPFVQILAVKPGPSGQRLDEVVLGKIKFVKKENPETQVEVDGGVNLETAKLAKRAGADILVSASYIWQSADSSKAYEALKEV